MTDSAVYEKVTPKQISGMKHVLGFSENRVRGRKHRKYEPYRNYFNTGGRDVTDWEQLVAIGFAKKSRENWYHVSEAGRIFLEHVTGVRFLPESD